MAYPQIKDSDFEPKLLSKKEFWQYRLDFEKNPLDHIYNDLGENSDKIIKDYLSHDGLILHSYQNFVSSFVNPYTPYKRLLVKHSTGSGKTINVLIHNQYKSSVFH